VVVKVSSSTSRSNKPHIKSIHIWLQFEGGRLGVNRLEVTSIYKTSQKKHVCNWIPETTTVLEFQDNMLKEETKIHEEEIAQLVHQGIKAPIVLMKPCNHQICNPIIIAFAAPSLALQQMGELEGKNYSMIEKTKMKM